jgi:hypothetical protein
VPHGLKTGNSVPPLDKGGLQGGFWTREQTHPGAAPPAKGFSGESVPKLKYRDLLDLMLQINGS